MTTTYDGPVSCIGLAEAGAIKVELGSERWRGVVHERYARGVEAQSGTSRLRHHVGLVNRDMEGHLPPCNEVRACSSCIDALR
jgi:protein SMG6